MLQMNGGFPPIKLCSDDKNKQELAKKQSKERFIANTTKQNINIRQILSDNKKKPIIITDNIDDNLEVIETL